MELKITDSHVHFWDVDKFSYPWLDDLPTLKRTLTLSDYTSHTKDLPIEKILFVQCECLPEQYLQEISYVTELASIDSRIQGIVSWFPLENDRAAEDLHRLIQNPLVKGIRRLEESPVSLYANPIFIKNLELLSSYQLSFEICLKSHQLPAALQLVEKKPDIQYMLDHMGKPDIKNKEINAWRYSIRLLAQNPNVYCKVSGLVTEADWQRWQPDDIRPYFDYALEQFGPDRLVYGSDWPVVTLSATYHRWLDTLLSFCSDFSHENLHKLFTENARRFYRLNQ